MPVLHDPAAHELTTGDARRAAYAASLLTHRTVRRLAYAGTPAPRQSPRPEAFALTPAEAAPLDGLDDDALEALAGTLPAAHRVNFPALRAALSPRRTRRHLRGHTPPG